jgi:hypothetical protein
MRKFTILLIALLASFLISACLPTDIQIEGEDGEIYEVDAACLDLFEDDEGDFVCEFHGLHDYHVTTYGTYTDEADWSYNIEFGEYGVLLNGSIEYDFISNTFYENIETLSSGVVCTNTIEFSKGVMEQLKNCSNDPGYIKRVVWELQ